MSVGRLVINLGPRIQTDTRTPNPSSARRRLAPSIGNGLVGSTLGVGWVASDIAQTPPRRVPHPKMQLVWRGEPAVPARPDRSSLPEPLRWDAERPVEARGRILPRDDHRHLGDGIVVVVPLHAREELVTDVTARLRDGV